MFGIGLATKVYVAVGPTDMRTVFIAGRERIIL
jgi:hypothetical protein